MAEAKKDAKPAAPEPFFTPQLIIGILVAGILLIGSGIITIGKTSTGELDLVPTGTIEKDSSVILKEEVGVRARPGGTILGEQVKRTRGVVVEGPVVERDQNWYRINFEEAPDGWVAESALTSVIWLFILVNIVPYLIDIVLPISITVILITGTLILIINAKAGSVPAVNSKEEQAYLARTQRTEIVQQPEPSAQAIAAQAPKENPRWVAIERMVESMNPSDWRQAVIEADIILDEMLTKIGYEGLTLADRLKNVEPSDMRTLDDAWRAHKIRNRIAHDGSNYRLDNNEAKNTIRLYRNVFEEFYYI